MKDVHRYYPVSGRVILHIDMNAFYCSVHAAEEPELYRGKACAVSGSVEQRKGIIVTSSYEARRRGIRTGMRVSEAVGRCPDLILIKPNFALYRKYSENFLRMVYEYTPLVEPVSIDECFADITGSKQFGTPLEIAQRLQERIGKELSLPCSIGVAPNKLLAKMASDMKKPNGITVLRKRDVPQVLWHRPCAELFGIGQKTAAKLKKLGITTIGQLAAADEKLLQMHFGIAGPDLKRSANGLNDTPVKSEKEPSKSIGHTTTLPKDVERREDVRRIFLNLADQVARRLRRQGLLAQVVQITIREPNMKTYTRSVTMSEPSDNSQDFFAKALELYDKHWPEGKPVRLLGVTLQSLTDKEHSQVQLDLFDYEQAPKKEALNEAMDRLRDKFGESAVLTAGMLGDDPSSLLRDHKSRGTSLQKDFLKSMEWDSE
ncbi:DNA polymerase IV [Marinicrinis lubricantis]|uniref:DNA polymerase IV n=1 Tax=Marinicrinis lubricantis TaxID=2086470 RepID=A0ABW1IT74_9BACL